MLRCHGSNARQQHVRTCGRLLSPRCAPRPVRTRGAVMAVDGLTMTSTVWKMRVKNTSVRARIFWAFHPEK